MLPVVLVTVTHRKGWTRLNHPDALSLCVMAIIQANFKSKRLVAASHKYAYALVAVLIFAVSENYLQALLKHFAVFGYVIIPEM
jgi:hypothetical protein